MDEDLRGLKRSADSGDPAARLRYRRAVERASRGGEAEGLVDGDKVTLRSCLGGRERVFTGVVRGVTPEGVPIVLVETERWKTDVTGCPRCTVTLL